MPPSSSLLLGRSHAGAWWLALQLAIGVLLCLYAWQAMADMYARRTARDGIEASQLLVIPWVQAGQGDDPGTAAVLRTLRALPGVRSVAAGNQAPYGTSAWSAHVWTGRDDAQRHLVSVYLADQDFMATLGMASPRGRSFAQAEYQDFTGDQRRLHADPAPAILSAALAERLYGDTEPLGRSLQVLPDTRLHVVGVLPRIPLPATAHRHDGTALILPVRMTRADETHFFVRYTGDADAMSARVRSALATAYPDAVFATPVSLPALRADASGGTARHAWTSIVVCSAWWLSTLGMLGLGGHRWVLDHRQEISLRRAFGATGKQLARRLRGEYLLLAVIASIIGMAAAALLAHLAPTWALSLPSPWTAMAVVVGTAAVVQCAATWPVRLAKRVPPHLVSRSPSVRL
jgi:putative ABC transport system permease protein